MITTELIQKLGYPGLPAATAAAWASALQAAATRYSITTPLRVAHWLAQIMHESGGLRWTQELASGAAYEGRTDLGNVYRGDGVRYKGRGPIQLTGRNNYRAAGNELGLPLEQHPELVERPDVGALCAARYFQRHTVKGRNLLEWADTGATPDAVFAVSWGVNGLNSQSQPNHLAERQARFNQVWALVKGQSAKAPCTILINGAGQEVPYDGRPATYGGVALSAALIEQLRTVYPKPGGPWQHEALKVWRRQNGDLVLEKPRPV